MTPSGCGGQPAKPQRYLVLLWLASVACSSSPGTSPQAPPAKPTRVGETNVMLGALPAQLSYPVDVTVANTGELIIVDQHYSLVLAAH